MFFKEQIKKRIKNEKGLTLIELLAVIVILAIIAAIAIPAIGNIIANSRSKAIIADAQNVYSGANMYFTDNPKETTVKLDTLIENGFLEAKGKLTGAEVKKESGKTTISVTSGVEGATSLSGTIEEFNEATVKKGKVTLGGSSNKEEEKKEEEKKEGE